MLSENLGRRVVLAKKGGLFCDSGSIVIRRARSADDLIAAYRLVHTVFVKKGYMDPNPDRIRIRPFEAVPEMATFVADAAGEIVGVMSIVPDVDGLGLPGDVAFSDELNGLRAAKRRVCEITNLAILEGYRRTNAFTELTRACLAQAIEWGCDDIFIAISPGHSPFFEGILQFDPCGGSRDYSPEKSDMVEGKRLNLRTVERRWREVDHFLGQNAFLLRYYFIENPYRDRLAEWASTAAEAFLTPEFLRTVFIEESQFLRTCDPETRRIIGREWGEGLLACVLGPARSARHRAETAMSAPVTASARARLTSVGC